MSHLLPPQYYQLITPVLLYFCLFQPYLPFLSTLLMDLRSPTVVRFLRERASDQMKHPSTFPSNLIPSARSTRSAAKKSLRSRLTNSLRPLFDRLEIISLMTKTSFPPPLFSTPRRTASTFVLAPNPHPHLPSHNQQHVHFPFRLHPWCYWYVLIPLPRSERRKEAQRSSLISSLSSFVRQATLEAAS